VSAIAWDPYDACHILVGARQGGIYRSTDYGRTWRAVKGSEVIPEVRGFYFPPSGSVVVASYGRGLWQLDVDRGPFRCVPRGLPPAAIARYRLLDPASGQPIGGGGNGPFPEPCEGCSMIAAIGGTIAAAEVDGRRLRRVALRAGNLSSFSPEGRETPLEFPNVTVEELEPERVPAIFTELERRGELLRGLVVRGGELVALVASSRELAYRPARVPRIRIRAASAVDGVAATSGSERARVLGAEFAAGFPVTLEIRKDGRLEAALKALPDERGGLSTELPPLIGAGARIVIATQQQAVRRVRTAAPLFVLSGDTDHTTRKPGA
jgi:hypothetical protein